MSIAAPCARGLMVRQRPDAAFRGNPVQRLGHPRGVDLELLNGASAGKYPGRFGGEVAKGGYENERQQQINHNVRRNRFVGLLTIAFIVLKLLGVISWSWLWVLSPIWISAALTLVIIAIVIIVALIVGR